MGEKLSPLSEDVSLIESRIEISPNPISYYRVCKRIPIPNYKIPEIIWKTEILILFRILDFVLRNLRHEHESACSRGHGATKS